ncbi:MAG: hypothetical protein LUC93_06500 [Planctomycetaceae bacterium]|nr:hypothetical protein [Planctomycetaceae bacterium]
MRDVNAGAMNCFAMANKPIAWDVLMLVGCSSVLAAVMQDHGAATWIATRMLGHVGDLGMMALMIVPLAYTGSCVFLLPVDPIPLTTYKYSYWTMTDMMKPGFVVAVAWVLVLTLFMAVAARAGIS